MAIYTFRNEMEGDNNLTISLIEELKPRAKIISQKVVTDELVPSYKVGVFTIEIDINSEDLMLQMMNLIEAGKRFPDLHRCYQTLAVGKEPNNQWFLQKDIFKEILRPLS